MAEPRTRSVGVSMPRGVSDALGEARALLKARDDPAVLDRAMNQLTKSSRSVPSVVVVGEVGRGKSMLVNALLGQPGLSPVGPGETTGGYLRFVGATDEMPSGSGNVELADGPRRISASELADWITIDGSRVNGPDATPVLGATVAVEPGLLGEATIVDTPGSGGLNEAHARLAISTAESASILLLVTDVSAPLTRPALDFLAACAVRVEAVVVAVNKKDLSRQWAARVDETREILRAAGPRFEGVEVVGVSAQDALMAQRIADPAMRDRVSRQAGLGELVDVLSRDLGQASRLPVRNLVRTAISVVEPVVTRLQGDLAAVMAQPMDVAEFNKREADLARLQALGNDLRYDWDRDCSTLRRALETQIELRLDEFQHAWQMKISDHRWGTSKSAQATLSVDLVAELAVVEQDLMEMMTLRFAELIRDLYENINAAPSPALLVELAESRNVGASMDMGPDEHRSDLDLSVITTGMMGFNLANTLGGVGLGALGVAGAVASTALAVGGGIGAVVMVSAGLYVRGNQKRRANLLAFLRERRGVLHRKLTRAYTAGFDLLRARVRKDFDSRLSEELATTRDHLQTAKRAAGQSKQERDDQARQIKHELDAASRVLQKLHAARTAGS